MVSYFACFLIKRIVLRSRFSLCSVGICIHVMLCKTKQEQSVVGAYETHFFTIKLLKVENNSVFLPFWNMSNLDQNDSLHNNERLIIPLHQKPHTNMRFRDFLQYVTVPPNFSKRVYVHSES